MGHIPVLVKLLLLMASCSIIVGAGIADGTGWTPIGGPVEINEPGSYYLAGDILLCQEPVCINITCGDVVLDGRGHRISGIVDDDTAGVSALAPAGGFLANVSVLNMSVSGFMDGISFTRVRGGVISGNKLSENARGIDFAEVSDLLVTENNASGQVMYGVMNGAGLVVAESNRNTFTHNILDYNGLGSESEFGGHGILLGASSSGNVFGNNTIHGNQESGIKLEFSCTGNHISGNSITGNSDGILILTGSDNNEILENDIRDNREFGMVLAETSGNLLRANTMAGNTYNFFVSGLDRDRYLHDVDTSNTVDGKTVSYHIDEADVEIGPAADPGTVYAIGCDGIQVKDVSLGKNGVGAFFWGSSGVSLENVTCMQNGVGMELDAGCDSVRMSRVRCNENNGFGIIIGSGSDVEIDNSSASYNTIRGILIQDSSNVAVTNTSASHNDGPGILQGIGIDIGSSQDVTLTKTRTSRNRHYGIRFDDIDTLIIREGVADENDELAVVALNSRDVLVEGMRIADNGEAGIGIMGIHESRIVNNYFNNTLNIDMADPGAYEMIWNTSKTAGTNIVDGPYLGGNYWAEPDGTGWSEVTPDRGDGFCNAPFVIDADNIDNLPLHLHHIPRIWTVCPSDCDFSGIQEAINAASDGDTIEVASGYYPGPLAVNRSLVIRGVDTGMGYPVVDAGGAEFGVTLESPASQIFSMNITGANSSAILVDNDDITLHDLTINHPKAAPYYLSSPAVTGEDITGLNISSCTFHVLRDTVVLNDPHNFSITGNVFTNPGGYSVAIVSSGSANPTENGIISGNTIIQSRGAGIGIIARSAGGLARNITISDNLISGSGGSIGLFIPSENVVIRNNSLTENTGSYLNGIYGIMTYGTSGVKIEDNRVRDTKLELAYRFEDCSGLTVTGNTADSNSDTGMGFLWVTNSTVSHNTMDNNVYNFWMSPFVMGPGVLPGNQIDQTNLADGKPVCYFEGLDDLSIDGSDNPAAIILYSCDNASIRDLACSANSAGVMALRSENLTVSGCSFDQMYYGTIAIASPNLTIRGNRFNDCSKGLMIGDFHDGIISDNLVENSADCGILAGIYLEDAIISDNTIDGAVAGIYLDQVSGFNNAVFSRNAIRDTYVAGISAEGSEGATISGNTLEPLGGVGFDISGSSSLTLTGNILAGEAANGVLLYNSPENTINSNIISASANGFVLQRREPDEGCHDNLIADNLVTSREPVLFCLRGGLGNDAIPSKFGSGPFVPVSEIPDGTLVAAEQVPGNENFICNPDPSPPANSWNISKAAGTNIIGGPYLGGNYWAAPDGTGWSEVTPDRGDGFCDAPLAVNGVNSDYLPLHIRTGPPFYADFTADPVSGNSPLAVRFTDASDGNIIRYLYRFGDSTSSMSPNPLHTYRRPGNFTVSLTIWQMDGRVLTSKTLVKENYIQVKEAPGPDLRANFSANPVSGSAPLDVAFTGTSTGTPVLWKYSFGDGFMSTQQNPAHTYRRPGNYTVKLTVWTISPDRRLATETLEKENYIMVA